MCKCRANTIYTNVLYYWKSFVCRQNNSHAASRVQKGFAAPDIPAGIPHAVHAIWRCSGGEGRSDADAVSLGKERRGEAGITVPSPEYPNGIGHGASRWSDHLMETWRHFKNCKRR